MRRLKSLAPSFGTANEGDRDGQRRRIRTRVSLLDIFLHSGNISREYRCPNGSLGTGMTQTCFSSVQIVPDQARSVNAPGQAVPAREVRHDHWSDRVGPTRWFAVSKQTVPSTGPHKKTQYIQNRLHRLKINKSRNVTDYTKYIILHTLQVTTDRT
jgi:hypothetical protein